MNRIYKRNSGFSLTEVLIAAGILTVGFMLLLTLFPLGIQLTAKNTENTLAMLSIDEAVFNASELIKSELPRRQTVPTNRYIDFRSLYWLDKDGDDIINDKVVDFISSNGEYELDYDPYLFLYPTAANILSEEKRYNTAMLIGQKNGSFAELLIFACRRSSELAKFPRAIVSDFNDESNLSDRPNLLSFDVDDTFAYDDPIPGNWIKISDDYKDVLDEVGLSTFITAGTKIINNRTYLPYMYGTVVTDVKSPYEDDNYYIVVDRNYSKATRRSLNKIWFIPPALGSSSSSDVGFERRTIRIEYE